MLNIFHKVFYAIGHFFSNAFHKAKPFLEKEIPTVIAILNGLKTGIDIVEAGPFKAVLDKLIGQVPAELLQKATAALPVAIKDLGLFKGVLDSTNTEQAILSALEFLKTIDPDKRALYINDIGALIVHSITDGKLSLQEAKLIIQTAYDEGINLHVFGF